MRSIWKHVFGFLFSVALLSPGLSMAGGPRDNVIGASGYDLTTYFSQEKPQRGNGNHVAEHDGVTYVFATDENKKTFLANPGKFLPQYGGYCAYGASVSKKFVSDPEQFDIVDGKLYLNLDSKVRAIWLKDVPGRIKHGDDNWKKIVNLSPSEL
ncbi:YHS domain protein [Paucibacter sp. TC2R-5]|uniref:YHS domain-containing (seleno)protein n=1 Tax=Paucibacter sp. TC2R-5 TaxID=2893555 RepID=UPI0021E4F4A0|nr:YHS domain-containing (seleno)protein [Paucibacter sp. TC2R-5]MCV2359307.1 YHS domain protein [Paucibacter sp. TC2R-5]